MVKRPTSNLGPGILKIAVGIVWSVARTVQLNVAGSWRVFLDYSSALLPFLGEGKWTTAKKCTLIPTSLLEDLVEFLVGSLERNRKANSIWRQTHSERRCSVAPNKHLLVFLPPRPPPQTKKEGVKPPTRTGAVFYRERHW